MLMTITLCAFIFVIISPTILDDTCCALMITKAYMVNNKLTAATFPMTEELVEFGFKARGEYEQHKRRMAQEEERAAAVQREKEERDRLQDIIRQDKERKSHLEALMEKERKHDEKVMEAQRCRLEAEVVLKRL